jgi:hypothetical protein
LNQLYTHVDKAQAPVSTHGLKEVPGSAVLDLALSFHQILANIESRVLHVFVSISC